MIWNRLKRRQPPVTDAPIRPSRVGTEAIGFGGCRPDGDAASVDPESSTSRMALLFLTTSCRPCQALWAGAAAASPEGLTIVTPSPETENRRRAAELAGGRASVVMSSEGWHRYGVTGSPWLVVVDGGVVRYDSRSPHDWNEVLEIASR